MSGPPAGVVSVLSAVALELPGMLDVLAQLAATDAGQKKLQDLEPASSTTWLRQQRERFEEVCLLLEEGPMVSGLEEPLLPLLDKFEQRDASVSGAEILQLAALLSVSHQAATRIGAQGTSFHVLSELRDPLPDGEPLRLKITRTLDRRGNIRDDASPKLATLRRQVRKVREGLYKELKGAQSRYKEYLSEETIPLKEGRLVLLAQSGASGRVKGLVHGRSATGRSIYFEPLEVVEANNRLHESIEEEESERRRILAGLVQEVRDSLSLLEDHLDFLGELDRLQASWRFAKLCDGRLAELGDRHELVLRGARHPLLDPRLAELRREALGQAGHTDPVVPLDLELAPDCRVLLITGPNAGGKTVALKTVGLLALLTQCGLPIPVEAGTRLPLFDSVMAAIGDDQDLLNDRSTFSGRLLRLKEAWETAQMDSLILLDEVGSGTDPEEGAALAMALLEQLSDRSTLAVLTTHQTSLAARSLELEGASCAAMEFDPVTGRPTFRMRPGSPGGSEALALGERLGLPAAWLERAEGLLGEEHRDLRRLMAEVERVRGELAAAQEGLDRQTAELSKQQERIAAEAEALKRERQQLGTKVRKQLEAFRQDTRKRLRQELERMRKEIEQGRSRGLVAEATDRLFEQAPQVDGKESPTEGPVVVGQRVQHLDLGWTGRVEILHKGRAVVRVQGKRVSCPEQELAPISESDQLRGSGPSVRLVRPEAKPSISDELNLVGWRVEPALGALDGYLDQALLSSHRQVRVVHGFGSGRLRKAVREYLGPHPAVASFRAGRSEEGGDGATVVTLKDD